MGDRTERGDHVTQYSNHLSQKDARIMALLAEMRPSTASSYSCSTENVPTSPLPRYDEIYSAKVRPPSYRHLHSNGTLPTNSHSFSTMPSYANRSSSTLNYYSQASIPFDQQNNNNTTLNDTLMRIESDESLPSNTSDSRLSRRNTPRQASFMAAIARKPLCTAAEMNGSGVVCLERRSDKANSGSCRRRVQEERRRTTIYGDEFFTCHSRHKATDLNQNEEEFVMRRTRPKSYVLATSASLPDTEQSTASCSYDDTSRELSSVGSTSSVEQHNNHSQQQQQQQHVSRSTNAPHPPATHRIQKFISLFSNKGDAKTLFRPKRSRTSLPVDRVPLKEEKVECSQIVKQGWMRYQEQVIGKNSKRNMWHDYYAILHHNSLSLLATEPAVVSSEDGLSKTVRIPPCTRIELSSSVSDIAYDWLKSNRNQHVIRLLTQSRREHLFQFKTESEMLSWITVLQYSSDSARSTEPLPQNVSSDASSRNLHSSCSVSSLLSSCSSHKNAVPDPAANQLIMHRYKAKTLLLQSPVATKRVPDHISQPGTSKEHSSTDNGEPTTPKSGRKWKKSKAGKQGSGSSSNSIPPISILGVRLADCALAPEEHVPLVVQMCVTVVETYGMETVGIYRIPGNTSAVNSLRDTLSQGIDNISVENMDFSDARWRDVNVVSSFLKMFLRKLPEPLLTDKLYPFFIDANRIANHHNRLHKLRNLLRKLPRHHYCTLRYIIRHLAAITKHSAVNKMETRNLALMFGPSIVRPSDDNMATMVTHMSDQCKIIETLVNYHEWMFNENPSADEPVPEQHPSEAGPSAIEPAQYGVGLPSGVSASTFNDMHNLIRKANEDQAAAMMSESKAAKFKSILRRNSRRDKSKGKLKGDSISIQSRTAISTQQSSIDSNFPSGYQERDIDAEIMSRQTVSPLASTVDHSPSIESSLGSLPDTSRTDPGLPTEAEDRKRRIQDMYSARRIFIAGPEAASVAATSDSRAIDDLANHTQHLNLANSPALEVLSEETREKIRKMQKKQSWIEKPAKEPVIANHLKITTSPTKDIADTCSFTSDYSTTSSAPISAPLAVACLDHPTSSDYASSDPSPCIQNMTSSPCNRPSVLPLADSPCQTKIRLRIKNSDARDASRRHTLSDVDALKEGRLDKLARWFGIRKSSPDITRESVVCFSPPAIIRTSPNELTPASGDELL